MIGYRVGKRLEADTAWNRNHLLLSTGITILLIIFIALQQWSVGNLGPKSDSMICSDYCSEQGYAGSGMPPQISGERTCSCYDNLGNEAIKIPLDNIPPDFSK